jgi:hypothetical protein
VDLCTGLLLTAWWDILVLTFLILGWRVDTQRRDWVWLNDLQER